MSIIKLERKKTFEETGGALCDRKSGNKQWNKNYFWITGENVAGNPRNPE